MHAVVRAAAHSVVLCVLLVPLLARDCTALEDSDIVFAAPTTVHRWNRVGTVCHSWRRSVVRALWVLPSIDQAVMLRRKTTQERSEVFSAGFESRRHKMVGDFRFAMIPLYAHDYFGASYKWLLHGDDDTVFFTSSLKRLLKDYDHTLPYFISDSFYVSHHRPHDKAPRCLPCHVPGNYSGQGGQTVPAVPGCPCRPELACEYLRDRIDMPTCISKKWRWHAYGGGGFVFSRALVEALAARRSEYETCAWNKRDYGDMVLTHCLWEMGFAPTDPGWFITKSVRLPLFDPFPTNNSYTHPDKMAGLLTKAKVSTAIARQLQGMVSWHVKERILERSRHFGKALSSVLRAVRMLDAYQQREGGAAVSQHGGGRMPKN